MSVNENPELAALLERATAVEPEVKADDLDDVAPVGDDPESVAALQARVEELESTVELLTNSEPVAAGEDPDAVVAEPVEVEPDADDADGFDFNELDDDPSLSDDLLEADLDTVDGVVPSGEAKADGYAPCAQCGGTDVDEYVGAPARCQDCGAVVTALEEKAFDLASPDLAAALGLDVKTTDTLSEMELLQARRAQLGA